MVEADRGRAPVVQLESGDDGITKAWDAPFPLLNARITEAAAAEDFILERGDIIGFYFGAVL